MAKKIFEVEISNRGPRGYETAALLKMPATWGEFNDALQKARIEDGRCCQNELTRIEYPGIQREMIGDNVDLYELNLLAQRLSELSKDELPAAAVDPSAPHRLLAGGKRLRKQTGSPRNVYHGRHRPVLHRKRR